MRTALDTLRLYGHMLGLSLRAQLQFRASFLMMVAGQFAITFVEGVGVWALFARFGGLTPWSLPQVAFFYGVVNAGFAITDGIARGFDRFAARFVKTGDFDRLLLRPRSTALQVAADEVVLARVGRLSQALLVMGWASVHLDLRWTAARVLLLLGTLIACVLFFYALFIFNAALAFWTTETLEVINILTHGGVETAQYPIAIYERTFRRFFTFVVPLACVAYFPVVAILDAPDPLGTSRLFQHLAPLGSLLFFGAMLLLWQRGVGRYTSTGS